MSFPNSYSGIVDVEPLSLHSDVESGIGEYSDETIEELTRMLDYSLEDSCHGSDVDELDILFAQEFASEGDTDAFLADEPNYTMDRNKLALKKLEINMEHHESAQKEQAEAELKQSYDCGRNGILGRRFSDPFPEARPSTASVEQHSRPYNKPHAIKESFNFPPLPYNNEIYQEQVRRFSQKDPAGRWNQAAGWAVGHPKRNRTKSCAKSLSKQVRQKSTNCLDETCSGQASSDPRPKKQRRMTEAWITVPGTDQLFGHNGLQEDGSPTATWNEFRIHEAKVLELY